MCQSSSAKDECDKHHIDTLINSYKNYNYLNCRNLLDRPYRQGDMNVINNYLFTNYLSIRYVPISCVQ